MSILIKGMEMPQKCGQCKLFHAEHPMHCQAVKASKDKRIIAPYGAPIPDWCPLVEIPIPHGRLGDLDELYKVANMADDFGADTTDILKLIIDTLTVIEAEGETE